MTSTMGSRSRGPSSIHGQLNVTVLCSWAGHCILTVPLSEPGPGCSKGG